jgi:hypothetical protein
MRDPVRNSDPDSCHQSAKAIKERAGKLRARIIGLARAAGRNGVTISEVEQQIPEHKSQSVSPRFAELVSSGDLVRVLVGYSKPTKRSPGGIRSYLSRFDTQTKKNVTLHWSPKFAPSVPKKDATGAEQPELPLEPPTQEAHPCPECGHPSDGPCVDCEDDEAA